MSLSNKELLDKTLFLKDSVPFISIDGKEYEVSNPEDVGGFYNRDETFIFKELGPDGKLMFFGPDERIEWHGEISIIHQIMGNIELKKWERTHEYMYSKFPDDRRRTVARLLPKEKKEPDHQQFEEPEQCGGVRCQVGHTCFEDCSVESSEPQEKYLRFEKELARKIIDLIFTEKYVFLGDYSDGYENPEKAFKDIIPIIHEAFKKSVSAPSESQEEKYTRQQVIDIIDDLLERPDLLTDAIENEDTNYDGEELLKVYEKNNPRLTP